MTIRIRRVKILKKSKYTLIYTKCKYDERVKKMTDIHSFQLNYIYNLDFNHHIILLRKYVKKYFGVLLINALIS